MGTNSWVGEPENLVKLVQLPVIHHLQLALCQEGLLLAQHLGRQSTTPILPIALLVHHIDCTEFPFTGLVVNVVPLAEDEIGVVTIVICLDCGSERVDKVNLSVLVLVHGLEYFLRLSLGLVGVVHDVIAFRNLIGIHCHALHVLVIANTDANLSIHGFT